MKKTMIFLTIMLLAFSINIFSDDKADEEKKMMTKWMEYSTPGKMHKGLGYFVGKWDAKTKYWMKPGEKAMETTGTSVAKLIMGGRYLKTVNQGKMMGMDHTGMSIYGYDNYKKKFVGTWLDSAGTGLFPYTGTIDSSGKVRTDTATWDDIMTGGTHDVRMVTTVVDKNTYKFEMYMKYPKMPEFKSMEMTYSRIKGSCEKKCCKKDKDNKTNK